MPGELRQCPPSAACIFMFTRVSISGPTDMRIHTNKYWSVNTYGRRISMCVGVFLLMFMYVHILSLSLYLSLYSSVSAYLVCLAVSVRLFLSLLLYVYKIVHVRACVYACLRARAPVIFLFRQLCFILKIRTYKHTKSMKKNNKMLDASHFVRRVPRNRREKCK